MEDNPLLQEAKQGDINAFQALFADFQAPLKSYLYRLLASRADADDLTHDTFIKAFDKLGSFQEASTLKTWVFQIATNLAYTYLHRRKRWTTDVNTQAKELVQHRPDLAGAIQQTAKTSHAATYDIKEHIDTCFTCMGKTLPIEQQVALMLKDIYAFSVKEIMAIMSQSEGTVKYLIQGARKTMMEIFDRRCALVSKNGICHQCSELNGWLNPKQDQQAALMNIRMHRESHKYDRDTLYTMRTELIQHIDPLKSSGNELQEVLMKCNRMAMGEVAST